MTTNAPRINAPRVCSICKSPNVTKSTCPLNKNAKNKNIKGHVNAVKKIKEYLKCKEKMKTQSQGHQRICHLKLRKQGYDPQRKTLQKTSQKVQHIRQNKIHTTHPPYNCS